MGIPKFFRWLSGRYPLVCERVTDDNIPEFDNLYLDMNGIIHNCTHPKDGEAPAPATDEERFLAIFNYIDFLFNKIRPQKVFFLGIDGVAPRAKMNEQRARRFRTAKELEEQQAKELRERRSRGEVILPGEETYNDNVFDPTCITPGTEFMDKLTEALRYYINKRVSEDANWRKPKVILSAPNVPGEGEHKIMDYIRFSRAQPGYSANTRHCLYGLDADLIMLGLLSHEPHFSLLREEVLFGARARRGSASADPSMQPFYLLHISILRDYLDHEFSDLKTQLGSSAQYNAMQNGQPAEPQSETADADKFDLERIIDDYVLMIMLVGNDFLPNLPKLSINGGALNFMFATYSRIRPSLGGYLHDNGVLNLERFEVFMREMARVEVDSFKLEVADHQWYQVYKHKALLRGETPDDSCVVSDADSGKRRGSKRSRGKGRGTSDAVSENEMFEYASMLGEVTIPIKAGKLVISKSQQSMLDLIRRFAIRALPKVAADRHKVQMQYLPGPATPLDNLIVSKTAELLELYVGHEYSHNGSMTLHVAAGSPKAIAKLELEDNDSTGDESSISSTVNFVSGSTAYGVLGGLEDSSDEESDNDDDEAAVSGQVGTNLKSVVPEFAKSVADPADAAAVSAYVNQRLSEFDSVLVVPDSEIDVYTRKGDASDFWQRFELWKANYYRTKLEATYEVPDITDEGHKDDASAPYSGQVFRSPPLPVEPMCRHYIMSLQWVLMYYFHGCQSWSWFYPYHYAPCISDICANLAAYKVEKFNNDPPYTPYEQLMCVLPPYSRKLLPAPLRALMVDVNSPIRDLFPTSFEVDMNGKKMPWEAVVLINFVDVDRIRAAMTSKLALLSEDETRRNSRGKNMLYSYAPLDVDEDSDDLPEYQTPSCLKFPSIRPLRCKGMLFVMPSLKTKTGHGSLQLIRGLVEGSVTRAHMRPGFPSLFTISHTAKLAFNATEVFGFPSKDESLVVTVLPDSLSQQGSAKEISAELANGKRVHGAYRPRRVFVAWPYLRDAVLVGVSDESGVYTIDASGTKIIYQEHSGPVQRSIWIKKHMDSVFQAKKMQAVILSETSKVLLHVLPLRGMKLYPNGSLVREYGFPSPGQRGAATAAAGHPWADIDEWAHLGVETYHPNMVLTDLTGVWVNNPRFAEHNALPLERSLPIASRAFFIGRTPLYGHPGKIVGHAKDRSGSIVGVDIQLVANTNIGATKYANHLGVNTLAHRQHISGERYRPSYIVAREIGISSLLLSRITSKMTIMDTSKSGDAVRLHVGLDLKFEAKRLKVIGYTKRGPNGWLFSDKAVDLISRYKADFPDMFARLDRRSDNDSLTASECFAPLTQSATDATTDASLKKTVAKQIERLKSWHKANIDRSAMVQVPIESEILTKGEIDSIVAAQAQTRQGATKRVLLRDIRREAVLRPVDAQYLLKTQSLMIGHRVVYVSDRSGSVPLGAKGYVVGIHAKESNSEQQMQKPNQSASGQHMARVHQEGVSADMIQMVEVVFDKEFIDGTTLEGRCPAYRGALVPPYQVLDLTSWGLGQNVSSKPSATPRTVDTIKPAPDTVNQRLGIGAGQTAHIAAKVRATFNRPAGTAVVDGEARGAFSVNVQEPREAPWINSSSSGAFKAKSGQAPANSSHATKIISQITSALVKPSPAMTTATAMAIPPADKEEEAHARNIINTLLAGPMEKMSIGDSSKEKGKGKNKAINVASVNDPAIISSNIQSTSALVGHPLVAGHMPLVIEEDYFSDSMDEDDSGEQRDSSKHKQIYYDYSKENAASNSAIRNGRGRGSANRSRGRGRGGNNSNNCTRTDANKDDSGSARGRGRGRGGYVRGRGGHGHGQSQGQSHNASSAL